MISTTEGACLDYIMVRVNRGRQVKQPVPATATKQNKAVSKKVNLKVPQSSEVHHSTPKAPTGVSNKRSDGPTCLGCGIVISEETKALQCDNCDSEGAWKCIACLNLTSEVYDILMADDGPELKWICEACDHSATSQNTSVKNLDKLEEIICCMSQLMDKLCSIENRLAAKADADEVNMRLDSKVDTERFESLEGRVAQIEIELQSAHQSREGNGDKFRLDKLEKQITDFVAANQKEEIPPNVDENVEELRERERRKNNIILFNVEESTKDDNDERKQDDKAAVDDILFELNIATELSNPVRLGPKREGSSYPRPMRITVEDETTKWNVLREAKNLRNAREEALKKIYVKKDMTPLEREKDAELRKLLLEKRKQAEEAQDQSKWIIRRGRIVRQH